MAAIFDNVFNFIKKIFSKRVDDPVYCCDVYKKDGCAHIDGPLCDPETCVDFGIIISDKMALKKLIYEDKDGVVWDYKTIAAKAGISPQGATQRLQKFLKGESSEEELFKKYVGRRRLKSTKIDGVVYDINKLREITRCCVSTAFERMLEYSRGKITKERFFKSVKKAINDSPPEPEKLNEEQQKTMAEFRDTMTPRQIQLLDQYF